MTIRPATAADAATLYRFICALAAYEREPDAVETTPARIAAQLAEAQPPFEALIAEGPAGAVGVAVYTFTYSTWTGRPSLYLEDLIVDAAQRGGGVGRRLMERLARIARARGCKRMDWQVLDWNAPAIGFYDRIGATPQSAWIPWRLSGAALDQLGAEG